jgi:hypothetical protein
MRPVWLRAGLFVLGAINIGTGFWASVDPESWWDSFPGFGHSWVSAFGPFNEHLVRDVGGLFLAFGVLFVLASFFLDKRFAGSALVAWLFFAIQHLVFHLRERGSLSSSDNLLSIEGLAFEVALPVFLLLMLPRIDLTKDRSVPETPPPSAPTETSELQ